MSTWKDRAEKVSDWKSRAVELPWERYQREQNGPWLAYQAADQKQGIAGKDAPAAAPQGRPVGDSLMTPDDFGSKIKAKYPDYAGMDNLELSRRVVAKYPEYASQVEFKDAMRGLPGNPDEISNAEAAKQAIGETLSEDVPYLGAVAKAVRSDIPGYIAEKSGQFGIPRIGAAVGTAIGTAGELIPQKGWELAALGAAKPLAAAGKYVGGAVAPKLISFLTRIEPPIVGRAIARSGELGKKELLAPAAIEDAIKGLGEGIKAGRSALGQKLAAIEDHIAARYTKTIPASDIGQKLAQKLSRAGFSVEGQPVGKVVRDLHPDISQVLGDFQDLGFKDALNLRRKIDDMVTYDRSKVLGLSDTQTTMLKGARAELNARIKAVSPRYEKATAAYAQAAQVYDDLAKDVLSGRPETIQKRIAGMFSKGSADRQIVEKVDKISERAGASLDTIFDSMTAQKFRPVLNPAVERAAFHTGGGIIGASGLSAATAMGHPGYALGAGAAMMATSPRLAGLGIRAFSSPVGQGQIPGLATGAVASLLAATRPPELSPNMQAILKAANARNGR